MHIIEIYRSLQGESSFAGLPCTFVRLAGCNLRCAWCDSEYTFAGGHKICSAEILAEVQRLSPKGGLVEITGGEPMLQERELIPFMQQLLACGYELLLETSGERPLEFVPREVHKIVDVKCPGSGEHLRFRLENLATLTPRDELKFVLASREDYEYARDFIRCHGLESKSARLILSPAFRKGATGSRSTENCLLDPRDLAEWMLADNLNARLGIQIHKYIWEPQLKGV
ncbi:MAG: 7-carboxy-7-deazaguanine synthase [Acidobacteria bacterium]|nr:MAG: 7-carboxy-7-deazaguanine synthase [Acidobacteriota bacterium]